MLTQFSPVRLIASVAVVTLIAVAPASAQRTLNPNYPYGLDPYNPSDAAWLRNYGAALVTPTPLLEAHALDPFKPSEASLLNQIGGAIPLVWYWPGGPVAPAFYGGPFLDNGFLPYSKGLRREAKPSATPSSESSAAAAELTLEPTGMVSAIRPTTNDGIWISYGGQTWVSAGKAVPFQDSQFQRAGDYAGAAVYRMSGGPQDVIYVPTRSGWVAPYRQKR